MATDVDKFHYRLVLLGSNGTGKTSILNRFLFKKFDSVYKPTVEDLFTHTFDLGSVEIKVDFLDTSGSMQFPAMRRLSLTTGSAFLIVYALDDEKSYEVVKMCIEEIREVRPDFQEIPIVFVGNKSDIPRDKQKVRKEVVSGYVHYELPRLRAKVIECSCKESINIDNIFRAYLSLAKVSVSTLVAPPHPPSSHSCSKNPTRTLSGNTLSPDQTLDECSLDCSRRSSSSATKVALGVRKSCDASILFPMKSTFVAFVSPNSPHKNNINSNNNNNNNSNSNYNNNKNNSNSSSTQQLRTSSKGDIGSSSTSVNSSSTSLAQTTEIVNLETAIQTKLSIKHSAKPRSRSLIWRPNRKSTRTAQEPECRVS